MTSRSFWTAALLLLPPNEIAHLQTDRPYELPALNKDVRALNLPLVSRVVLQRDDTPVVYEFGEVVEIRKRGKKNAWWIGTLTGASIDAAVIYGIYQGFELEPRNI